MTLMVFQTIGMFVLLAAVLFGTFKQNRRYGTRSSCFCLFSWNLNIQSGQWIDKALRSAGTVIATAAICGSVVAVIGATFTIYRRRTFVF